MHHPLSLLPLAPDAHEAALTRLYRASPRYRATQDAGGNPYTQAQRDLAAVAAASDRTLLGIMQVTEAPPAQGGAELSQAELVGLIDFRRHWPKEDVAYIGLMLVAESLQRQGIGRQAWAQLEPWLAGAAAMRTARCGVEQSNPIGLRFMQKLGFTLTGESDRIRRGERWVRLLYMEKGLG